MRIRFRRSKSASDTPVVRGEDVQDNEGVVNIAPTGSGRKGLKRLRPRWQRWLLWAAVRLLLVAGVGVGVGTVQIRLRPPDLMRHARRVASLEKVNGYYWLPNGELRLYRHQKNGTASLRWDAAKQSSKFVEMLKLPKGKTYVEPMRDHPPYVLSSYLPARMDFLIVEAYNTRKWFDVSKPMPKPDYEWKIKYRPNLNFSDNTNALSPDGKQVAFACTIPRTDWRDVLMQKLKRGYKAPFRGQGVAILVSAVDGSRTDMVGTLKTDMPGTNTPYARSGTTFSLQGLFWCPDGKHLSFAYGDGVYEVPVK